MPCVSGKTFIHHDGALGDVLLSLPCISAVREGSGTVHLAARPDIAGFLKDMGCVDEASSSGSGLYASLLGAGPDARGREFLSQFGRAVVFTVRHDSPVAASLRGIIPLVETVTTVPPAGERTHVAEHRLRQLRRNGAPGLAPMLTVPPGFRERAEEMLSRAGYERGRRLIALHPGSGGAAKRWPLERFFDLAGLLKRDRDPFVVLITGPAEDDAFKGRVESFSRGRKGVLHFRDPALSAAAALLSLCGLFIGNDSGIAHLAAAAGCGVVALFGPTDPALWRPAGPKVTVVSASGRPLSTIGPEEVYAAIEEMFMC